MYGLSIQYVYRQLQQLQYQAVQKLSQCIQVLEQMSQTNPQKGELLCYLGYMLPPIGI